MKVKFVSTSHGKGELFFNDEQVSGAKSIHINVCVNEINRVVVEYIPDVVEFEGESVVMAVINGQKYKLIEDMPITEEEQNEIKRVFQEMYSL